MRRFILLSVFGFGFVSQATDLGITRINDEGDYAYRNQTVHLNAHESKLVEFMLDRGGLREDDHAFARAMHWGLKSAPRRTERLVAQINHQMLLKTGAPVLKHEKRGARVRLDFYPVEEPLPEEFIVTPYGWYFVGGKERSVLEVLNGHLNWYQLKLFISEEQFRRIGLPLNDLKSQLNKLNHRVAWSFLSLRWIESFTVNIMHDNYTTRFSERQNSFGDFKPNPFNCPRNLTGGV